MTSQILHTKKVSLPLSYVIFTISGVIFIAYAYISNQQLNPFNTLEKLYQQEQIQTLDHWTVRAQICSKHTLSSCQDVLTRDDVSLINQTATSDIIKQLNQHPDGPSAARFNLYLTHTFTFSQLAWIRNHSQSHLVIPSFAAQNIRTFEPEQSPWQLASNSDLNIPITESIIAKKRLTLQVMLSPQAKVFGGYNIPPAVVPWNLAQLYGDLDQRRYFSSYLHRARNIILPLVISALMIILNHSLITQLLSYIAVVLAGRTFLATLYELFPSHQYWIVPLLIMLLALSPLCLARMLGYMVHFRPRWPTVLGLGALSCSIHFPLYYFLGLNLTNLSNYSDTFSTFIGFAIALAGTAFPRIWQKPRSESPEITTSSETAQKHALALAAVMLGVIFLAHLNTLLPQPLISLFISVWGVELLLPALFFITLVHIGSIVNTIRKVSTIVKAKAKVDRDIEISKELQSSILPKKKHQDDDFSWHAFYFPASHLAGDWFDLRRITTKNQKSILLGCIVDVTGHGISSAMMTSNIASHWGLWCLALEGTHLPDDLNEREQLLATAPRQIHRGLIGLRYNLGCSMAVVMYDPASRELTYLTAGHPGVLVCQGNSFQYLTSRGTRPGIPNSRDVWNASSVTLDQRQNHQIILYTDGVVKEDTAVPVWLKQIRRKSSKAQRSPIYYITSQLRASRRYGRKNPEEEDDLTLLIIEVKAPKLANTDLEEEYHQAS